jgi:uncharacterized protein YceK
MKKRSIAILLSLVLILALAGCGGSAKGDSYYSTNSAASEPAAPMEAGADGEYWAMDAAAEMDMPGNGATANAAADSRSTLPDGVKMIYRASLELETTEFDQAAAQVKALTAQMDGYFEEQNTYTRGGGYRSATYTVRVPAARFEEFLSQIGSVCTVVRQSQSAEDVSEYYYDMESRLETAKIKLDRLQELLSKAEEMEDIITLEGAISDTEYQIEQLSGEKRHYDSLIGYSTINVNLSEVYRVTEVETAPLTFGQRMGIAFRDGLRNFGDGMEDFLEWLAYSWLTLLVVIAVIVVIVKLIRSGSAKRANGEKKPRRKLFGKKNKDAAPAETTEQNKEE